MLVSSALCCVCRAAIVVVLKSLGVVLSSPTDLNAWKKKLNWKKVLRATIISLTQSSATVSLSYVVGYLGFSDRTVGKLTKSTFLLKSICHSTSTSDLFTDDQFSLSFLFALVSVVSGVSASAVRKSERGQNSFKMFKTAMLAGVLYVLVLFY